MYELPYGNTQQLNLDWFIKRWQEFYAQWQEAEAGIDHALDAEIQRVEDAMSDLYAARDAAAASATAAAASAASASTDATAASNAATAAAASATLANNKAAAAGLSEANAAQSATNAGNSASAAATSASQANASESAATASAQAASASETAAATSETNAAASETNAAASAADAADSAQRAEDAATIASAVGVVKSVENVPIANVEDALNENVVELVIGIDPVQTGTGDPAPDNVRPITGWTGANVYSSGADTSNPDIISIAFPSSAGTVYGGTLTNANGEWTLRVDKAGILLDGINNQVNSAYGNDAERLYGYVLPSQFAAKSQSFNWMCDTLKPSRNVITEDNTIALGDNFSKIVPHFQGIQGIGEEYATGTELANAINTKLTEIPAFFVYELANPVEYAVPESQTLTLLNGVNNIWADTGNIDLLRYYTDSKGYIDAQDALVKALIAKELDDMIADTALTANDFRIVNNTLYRITAPVASGATLTPNTNCTATTVGEILKTLLT